MTKRLYASDVADSFKTKRYWQLMEDISNAAKAGQVDMERRLHQAKQEELRRSLANQRAGKMIHK